jgi:hypothetical protein
MIRLTKSWSQVKQKTATSFFHVRHENADADCRHRWSWAKPCPPSRTKRDAAPAPEPGTNAKSSRGVTSGAFWPATLQGWPGPDAADWHVALHPHPALCPIGCRRPKLGLAVGPRQVMPHCLHPDRYVSIEVRSFRGGLAARAGRKRRVQDLNRRLGDARNGA